MTTEEKARAYDEALEKAREIKGKIMSSHLSTEGRKAVSEYIDTIIPELAESEDERIREDLIGGLMWQRDNLERLGKHDDSLILPGFCRTVGEHLAYLEKKKETGIRWFKSDEVKNPDKPYIDKAGMFYTTDGRMCHASEIEKQKEQKVSVDDFKAKDWYVSKVDGKIHNIYYSVDKVKPKFKVGDKIIEKDFDECGRGTIIDIKDGKYIFDDGGFICIEEQGLWKLVEQKPVEWSDEDEDMLNSCISSIEEAKENRYAYKETDGDTSYDHEIAWLKSIRPSKK